MEKTRLSVMIDADLHKSLKLQAVTDDKTIAELVAEAVKDLLTKKEKQKG